MKGLSPSQMAFTLLLFKGVDKLMTDDGLAHHSIAKWNAESIL